MTERGIDRIVFEGSDHRLELDRDACVLRWRNGYGGVLRELSRSRLEPALP
jgi:hypothetical protein